MPVSAVTDPVEVAQRVADEVLFPGALAADAAATVPRDRLDAIADAGLYGLAGPPSAGGMAANLSTICAVTEALASGCLTSAFVWSQHVTTVFVVGASPNPAMASWVRPMCEGIVRAGLALAGSLPDPPLLRAARVDGGWLLTGTCPWVSGWGRIDVVHTAAVTEDGSTVWALVDAKQRGDLQVQRTPLVALNATATVDAEFLGRFVPDDRVTLIVAPDVSARPPEATTFHKHAALALGVANRCCRLLGPSPLDDQLAACRRAVEESDPATVADARAGASELALHSAAALMATTGSRSLRTDAHPQRLAREALFVGVFAVRSPIREAWLARLGA